jgi:hypothetical protein
MGAKFTPWFPQTVRPARPGVYQREMDYYINGIGYAKWDGRQWFPCCGDPRMADETAKWREPSGYQDEDEGIRWRGLASAPKALGEQP